MATITIMRDETRIGKIRLAPGAMFIGRGVDNDVKIDDTTISTHHAKIVTYFKATYIEDLDSTNGTYINGKRVQKHTLHPGDIVQVGKHRLMVEPEESRA